MLNGGVYTVMEEPTDYETFNGGAAWLGDNGIVYNFNADDAKLFISLPDNATVEIDDFQNGDFGMTFDEEVPPGQDSWMNLPRANIADEHGLFQFTALGFGATADHLADLSGRQTAFDYPGSYDQPDLTAAMSLYG